MTKAVDTWMPLLIDKYLGDTTDLSTEQHGAYLLLLMAMWKKDGYLPNDDARLASITRLTPQRWKANRSVLLEFFSIDGDRITQKRLTEELANSKRVTEARAEAGAKGAAKRWQTHSKGIANSSQMDASRSTPLSSSSKKPKRASAPPAVPVDELVAVGFDARTAEEFIAHKDRLKAPLTSRAWRDHIAEAAKAGWTPMQAAEKVMARGWKGFDASYVADEAKPGAIVSFRERDAEAAAQRVREMTGGVLDNRRGEVLDGLTRIA